MSDLKSVQIRNGYDELLTKGAGTAIEDGDGVPFIGAIVNDLTTGGATAPLSAEQGVELQNTKANLTGGADANFTAMPQVGGNAIISRGSNSDGEYVRFADGTQICRITAKTYSSVAISSPAAGGFRSSNKTWGFPIAFSTVPTMNAISNSDDHLVFRQTATTNNSNIRAWRAASATKHISFSAIAIGRWF